MSFLNLILFNLIFTHAQPTPSPKVRQYSETIFTQSFYCSDKRCSRDAISGEEICNQPKLFFFFDPAFNAPDKLSSFMGQVHLIHVTPLSSSITQPHPHQAMLAREGVGATKDVDNYTGLIDLNKQYVKFSTDEGEILSQLEWQQVNALGYLVKYVFTLNPHSKNAVLKLSSHDECGGGTSWHDLTCNF